MARGHMRTDRRSGARRPVARLCLLPLALLLCAATAHGDAAVPPRHLLVLSSYHQGHAWTDEVTGALAASFGSRRGIELHVEHLDARRSPAPEEQLLALYAKRYAALPFAAIVAIDQAALELALAHREQFGDAPIVFCGVNDLSFQVFAGKPEVTGVVEELSVAATIDFALGLQPRLRRLVVVNDTTETGRRAQRLFEKARPRFDGRLEFEVLQGRTFDEVRQRLSVLGQDSAVLLFSFYRDGAGHDYSTAEFVEALSQASPVPVYAVWKHYLPHGVAGGVVASGEEQGRVAARLVERVLGGESASSIPVLTESPNVPTADFNALERFGLDDDRLPPGTVVLHRPPSFFAQHRQVILLATAFLLMEGLALVLLARSVVRQRRAERALRDSNARQRAVLDAIPDLLFEVDLEERLVDYRATDPSLLYLPPEQFLGKPFSELLPTEAIAPLREALAEAARAGRHLGAPYCLEINGERRHYEPSIAVRRGEGGERVGFLVLSRDVTERIRASEQRQAMQRAAEHNQRLESLGVLAAGIAHDFNNLLCGIFNAIDLAAQTCEDAEARDNLMLAGSALDRAQGLTRQLLTFSKGGAPIKATGDLASLVRDTAAFSLSGKPVRAHFEFPHDLWATAFDAPQLAQVIQNLVLNAVEAMPHGGALEVTASNARFDKDERPGLEPGEYVRVAFRDHGDGIRPDVLPHIFEPFFTTKKAGSGLGLATSFSIVKKHGGLLAAESRPGQGATVSMWLPAVPRQMPRMQPPGPSPVAGEHRGRGRILLLDDEELIRDVASGMLSSMGYDLDKAATGEKALELYRAAAREEAPFALALLDLTVVGGLGGQDVARELRASGTTMPLVAISGYSDSPVLARPSDFGFDAALGKPFQRAELSDLLERLLGRPAEPRT